MKIGESGNMFTVDSHFVLSSYVTFGNIWLMSCPQVPVHYSLRLVANLLGMSAPDKPSLQCGRLAVSKSFSATRVAKGIPATLPQRLQITEMIIETFLCGRSFQRGASIILRIPQMLLQMGKAIFFPFNLLYEMIVKQRTEACFIFGVLLGTVFCNLPPTQTQKKQLRNNPSNIQCSLGCYSCILSSFQSIRV